MCRIGVKAEVALQLSWTVDGYKVKCVQRRIGDHWRIVVKVDRSSVGDLRSQGKVVLELDAVHEPTVACRFVDMAIGQHDVVESEFKKAWGVDVPCEGMACAEDFDGKWIQIGIKCVHQPDREGSIIAGVLKFDGVGEQGIDIGLKLALGNDRFAVGIVGCNDGCAGGITVV